MISSNRKRVALCFSGVLAACIATGAIVRAQHSGDDVAAAIHAHLHDPGGYFLSTAALPLSPLIPLAPNADSAKTHEELAELHRIEANRTPAQIKAAQADDGEEDIFIYRAVLGPGFAPDRLPAVASFQSHVLSEAVAASSTLKDSFLRVRPYRLDSTLHPVCQLTNGRNSYPSGHTVVGYLMALTLAEMMPEQQAPILARADAYAHNRLVCGVHYPSDLEGGKLAAYAVFGELMRNPVFQADLKQAAAELRKSEKLPALQ